MKHDYAYQRTETFDTFTTLQSGSEPLPEHSVVEFYLLAESTQSDWHKCAAALKKAGYITQEDRAESTLIIRSPSPIPITPEAIWEREELITRAALPHDFTPDGWEFGFD